MLKYQLISSQNFVKGFFIILVVSLVLTKPCQAFFSSLFNDGVEFAMLEMEEESEEEDCDDKDEKEEYISTSISQIKIYTFPSKRRFENVFLHSNFIKGIIVPPPRLA